MPFFRRHFAMLIAADMPAPLLLMSATCFIAAITPLFLRHLR